jgi:hypothetical protein
MVMNIAFFSFLKRTISIGFKQATPNFVKGIVSLVTQLWDFFGKSSVSASFQS